MNSISRYQGKTWKSEDLSRKEEPPKEEKQRLKEVRKQINKCVRDKKKVKRQEEIQRILEDLKGIKNIPGVKSAKTRVLTTKIKNEKGDHVTERNWQCLWIILQKNIGRQCKKRH